MNKFLLAIFYIYTVSASRNAIYGDFDIKDITRAHPYNIRNQSMSVATVLNKHSLTQMYSGEFYKRKTLMLDESIPVCSEDSPWSKNEIRIGSCSSFLVAPNLMLTAGHCFLNRQWDCDQKVFLFDGSNDFKTDSIYQYYTKSQIYSCKSIVKHINDGEDGIDFALIELDRDVEGREPVNLNVSSDELEEVYMIGHPLGMSQKISSKGKVRSINELNIITELDSFSGNSGSPVFSSKTNILQGMLVSGEDDFKWNDEKECFNHVYCTEGSCKGESVIRADLIYQLIKDDL